MDDGEVRPGWRGLGWWVLGAGVVGAIAFPGVHTGIGWVIGGLAVAVIALVARRHRDGKALAVPMGGKRPGSVVEVGARAGKALAVRAGDAQVGLVVAADAREDDEPAGGDAESGSVVAAGVGADGTPGAEAGGRGVAGGGVVGGGVVGGGVVGGGVASRAGRVDRAWQGAAGLAALVLLAIPGIRAAVWLDVLCVLAAGALGSYSLAGGRSWAGIGLGVLAVPRAVPAGVGLVARTTTDDGDGRRWRVLAAAGVGLVLVMVFGAMFRAADERFERLISSWVPDLSAGTVVRWLFGFVLVGAVAAGVARVARCGAPTVHDGETKMLAPDERTRLRTAEWAVPLGMLVALFAVFVGTQLGTLFGGREHVLDPRGPDFAEYARTGFGLLFLVTVLTLGVVAALSRFAGRTDRRDRMLLRGLGGALCGLTLVIVASALERIHLYAGAYGFSHERLLGYAVEVWLGLLFVLVLVAGRRLRANWLPRAVTASAVVMQIGVAAVNPEALMARTHIDRLEHGYPLDTAFLDSLSADAAEEIEKVPPVWRTCDEAARPAQPDPWYRFNLSRHRAHRIDDDTRC
ncbi:DUF4153 domain-containing protein [Virgisporangium aurantiacum]|uniref:DUF4173 domain-containing protein n=1 Tax=Virgisporangium aurantiacum TaxID=175570 RepID=A0A8J4DYM5_9ACTN|nr:DUF4173 domain-containing protein [Virgisporangium aurantiacum]GIJ55089.1 hypothetical protein Vau01_026050 [Virgisporangium aurantiacum]